MSRSAVTPRDGVRDARRAEIIDCARLIVAGEGLEALTFSALEQRLAFTRGVITYHFRNKDELVHAVLDAAIADIEADAVAAVRAADGEQAVRAVLAAMVTGFLRHPDAANVMVSYWGRLRSEPRLAGANAGLYQRWRGFCAELVRRGQRDGRFRTDVDAQVVAGLIVGQVVGLCVQALFEPDAIRIDAALDLAADAFIDRLRPIEAPPRSGSLAL